MYKVLIIATLAVLSASLPFNMKPHDGELIPQTPPEYRLDLNVEPYHRWDHIAPDFKGPIKQFQNLVLNLLPLSEEFYDNFGEFCINDPNYAEWTEEVKGIANVTGTDWRKILLANFIYDISSILPHPQGSFCSSIVTKNELGTIYHARNMDFWPWKLFSKDTAKIKVYRGDKYVAEFDQVMGSVFVLSGIKKGSFSVTVDTRKFEVGTGGLQHLIDNITKRHYYPSAFLTRKLLSEDDITYEEAVEQFKNTNTTAPVFYIVAGLDKGSVIEKRDVGYNHFTEIGPDTKEWYIVQTNYDRDEDPGEDERRIPAELRLDAIGEKNITQEKLYDVITKWPSINLTTIYTTQLYPTDGSNIFTAWYGIIDEFKPWSPFSIKDQFKALAGEYIEEIHEDLEQYQIQKELYKNIMEVIA